MYRVTSLLNGVATGDWDEFPSATAMIHAMEIFGAPTDYVDEVKRWLANGAHEPLVVHESSVHADLFEYVP